MLSSSFPVGVYKSSILSFPISFSNFQLVASVTVETYTDIVAIVLSFSFIAKLPLIFFKTLLAFIIIVVFPSLFVASVLFIVATSSFPDFIVVISFISSYPLNKSPY